MKYKEMDKEDLRELALENVQEIRDFISEEIDTFLQYEIINMINELENKVMEL